jgi:hypothetical protein
LCEIEEEEEDVGDVGDVTEKEVQQFGSKDFGLLASLYVTPYLYNRPCLDRDLGICKDVMGNLQ